MKLAYRFLNTLIAVLLVTTLILTPRPAAAGDSIPELFGPSPVADVVSAALPDPLVQRARTAGLNLGMLDAVQTALAGSRDPGPLALTLFPGVRLVARFQRVEHSLAGGLTLVGKLDGSPFGEIHLSRVGNSLYASLNTGSSLYAFKSLDDQAVQITQIDSTRLPPEEDLLPPVNPAGAAAPVASVDLQTGPGATDDGSRIDVYVGYTSAVRAADGGTAAIQARIATAIAETNTGYANGGVSQRVALVGTAEYAYNESGFDWQTTLTHWRNYEGVFAPAQTARDTLRADEMVLIVNDEDFCGLGYLMSSVSASFAPNAFALVSRTCATGYYSFAHEMGHNMGAHHERYSAGTDQGAYPYSYGYWIPNPATGRYDYRTIMAYDTKPKYSYSSIRVNYWSNPNVILPSTGTPVGKPVGDPEAAFNALTLNNTAPFIAQFRDGSGPVAPASLTALAQVAAVRLDWTFSGSDVSKFRIERSDYGLANWTEIGQTAPNVLTYTDATVAPNLGYSYRVLSDNGNGRTASPAVNTLNAPSNLVISSPAFGQLKFDWTDTSANETGFSIERTEYGLNNWAVIGQTAANVTTYTDPAALGNKDYSYRVLAVNGDVKAASAAGHILGIPSALHTSFVAGGKVQLDWTDNSALETGYQVWRTPGGVENWAVLPAASALPAGTHTYLDTPPAGEYRYRVRAVGAAGVFSFYSNLGYTLPNSPTALSATVINQARINLSWTDNSLIESGYPIEASPDGSTVWQMIATAPAVVTNPAGYSISDLVCNTPYYFQIRAQNSAGTSLAYSNVSPGLTTLPCTAPGAPPAAAAVRSAFSITLNWMDVDGETGYRVEKLDNSNWVVLIPLPINVTTYRVAGLRPSTGYQFRVIAVNTLALGAQDSPPTIFTVSTTPVFTYLPRVIR